MYLNNMTEGPKTEFTQITVTEQFMKTFLNSQLHKMCNFGTFSCIAPKLLFGLIWGCFIASQCFAKWSILKKNRPLESVDTALRNMRTLECINKGESKSMLNCPKLASSHIIQLPSFSFTEMNK